MSLRCILRVALFGVGWGFIANSNAALVYDESSTGDLSNNGLNPTFVLLSGGANEIRGSTGKGTSTITDRDYFTVSVPVGLQLSSLVVLPGTAVSGEFSFIGLQSGSQLSVSPSTSDATGLLGWRHYSSPDLNKNILPSIGVPANGSAGFTPPLPTGDYAFWVQDTGSGSPTYNFNLVLSQVPEPASLNIALVGLVVVAAAVRLRRSYQA